VQGAGWSLWRLLGCGHGHWLDAAAVGAFVDGGGLDRDVHGAGVWAHLRGSGDVDGRRAGTVAVKGGLDRTGGGHLAGAADFGLHAGGAQADIGDLAIAVLRFGARAAVLVDHLLSDADLGGLRWNVGIACAVGHAWRHGGGAEVHGAGDLIKAGLSGGLGVGGEGG